MTDLSPAARTENGSRSRPSQARVINLDKDSSLPRVLEEDEEVPSETPESDQPVLSRTSFGQSSNIGMRAVDQRPPSAGRPRPEARDKDTSTVEDKGVLITEVQIDEDENVHIARTNSPALMVGDVSAQDFGGCTKSSRPASSTQESRCHTPRTQTSSILLSNKEESSTNQPRQLSTERSSASLKDEDFDTDLDIEEEDETQDPVTYYKQVCEQLAVPPVDYLLRHLGQPHLSLRYRGMDPLTTRAIALCLRKDTKLERLDLSSNWMGPEGAGCVARLLEENDAIWDLALADNKLGSPGGEYMAKMIRLNTELRRLNLSGNQLDDRCAESLALSLENNKYLRELDLSHNNFTEEGAVLLGAAIAGNENLDVLDLSWNQLRERGGVQIAKGLQENVRLKELSLAWNGLSTRGGLALVQALTTNQSLLSLDVSGNRLTTEVATTLARVLTVNDTIRTIKMGNNLITSAGVISLASTINKTENLEIQELDLTDIPVEFEFLRTVQEIKRKRPKFKVKHGPIMRAGNTRDDLCKPGIDVNSRRQQPLVILQEHIVVNDLRLLEVLKKQGKSGLSLTSEDLFNALEELSVPYDKETLQEALGSLSRNGTINIGNLISSDDFSESVARISS